jgi:hypothetical protein
MEQLLDAILATNSDEKVVIFTEYRSTQDYLKQALEARFGQQSVQLINGSMPHPHRRNAIAAFEQSAQFLVSTEAGGEGINLQRHCHVMVNYDLPWNPMRLVQRIGRLYRYGQQQRVVVFNVHSPGTVDEQVMQMMYSRIDQVVNDMAGVGREFNERLRDDILGEMADLMDVDKILADATVAGIQRTQQRIEQALAKAKAATAKQRELFEHAASFDPNETRHELRIGPEHSSAFVQGMFRQLAIEVIKTTHNGLLWHIRLPDAVQTELGTKRSHYQVTVDRLLAAGRPGTTMLDLDSLLMKYLIRKAKAYDFMGLSAVIRSDELNGQALFTSLLRWQNDQGRRLRQEYTAYMIDHDQRVAINPEAFSEWLKHPAQTGSVDTDKEQNKRWFQAAEAATDRRLAEVSNQHLHPENNQWVSVAWLDAPPG